MQVATDGHQSIHNPEEPLQTHSPLPPAPSPPSARPYSLSLSLDLDGTEGDGVDVAAQELAVESRRSAHQQPQMPQHAEELSPIPPAPVAQQTVAQSLHGIHGIPCSSAEESLRQLPQHIAGITLWPQNVREHLHREGNHVHIRQIAVRASERQLDEVPMVILWRSGVRQGGQVNHIGLSDWPKCSSFVGVGWRVEEVTIQPIFQARREVSDFAVTMLVERNNL